MSSKEKIFSTIVKENQASVYRICLAYLYNTSHAADLYQEILLQAWKSLDNYRGDAKTSTWIYRIAVNTAITYNHQYKKQAHQLLPPGTDIPDDNNDETATEESLNKLRYHISRLEEQDRLIISLVLEDLSYKEIADVTGTTTNLIGVKISRVKTRLLKMMTEETSHE